MNTYRRSCFYDLAATSMKSVFHTPVATGLSAALHLARNFDVDVRVLEAGHIGWGASGRNEGFCTMASTMLSPTFDWSDARG